jgi:PAS domain S-box-containing protein
VALHNRIATHIRTRTLSIQFARSEARFTALIRTATDAVFILDRDATIAFVNPAVEEVLGYEPRELVGEPVTTLIPEASREAASAGIAEAFATGEVGATASIEARALHRDGHELPVRLSYNLFRSNGTVWLAGIVHDVTDLMRREQRLRVLNRVLRHDIRNDVNVIQGWAERLRRSGENVPRYTACIEEKAEEIVRLSDQARRVERLSASGDEALRDVDLVRRLTDQLDRFRRANPGVTLNVDVPWRANVVAHPLVDSAVDNVLENAVEHNDADRPSVDVRLSEIETNEFELRIADDGPGIPAEELAALETGDEGPLTHTSGLGLWLTKWIVAASGGAVRFAENEPSGTVVSMRFTRAEGRAETD